MGARAVMLATLVMAGVLPGVVHAGPGVRGWTGLRRLGAVCLGVCLRREALLIRVEVRDLHR